MKKETAFKNLLISSEHLNEGWAPDWNKETMEMSFGEGWKWRVIFIQPSYGKPQLVAVSCSSTVESPIHFKSKELAERSIHDHFDSWVDFLGVRDRFKELDV